MGQILVRNLDDKTIETLRWRARRGATSLEAEARRAIERGLALSKDEALALVDEMLAETERLKVPGAPQTESWRLIREDRDRDGR
jgi:plasmid stability protein